MNPPTPEARSTAVNPLIVTSRIAPTSGPIAPPVMTDGLLAAMSAGVRRAARQTSAPATATMRSVPRSGAPESNGPPPPCARKRIGVATETHAASSQSSATSSAVYRRDGDFGAAVGISLLGAGSVVIAADSRRMRAPAQGQPRGRRWLQRPAVTRGLTPSDYTRRNAAVATEAGGARHRASQSSAATATARVLAMRREVADDGEEWDAVAGSLKTRSSVAVAGSVLTVDSAAVAGSVATRRSAAVAGSAVTADSTAVAGSAMTQRFSGGRRERRDDPERRRRRKRADGRQRRRQRQRRDPLRRGNPPLRPDDRLLRCTRCIACIACSDCVGCIGCVGCSGLRGAVGKVGVSAR